MNGCSASGRATRKEGKRPVHEMVFGEFAGIETEVLSIDISIETEADC